MVTIGRPIIESLRDPFHGKGQSGLSGFKNRISRQLGIPLTRSGRQWKIGRATGGAGEERLNAVRGAEWNREHNPSAVLQAEKNEQQKAEQLAKRNALEDKCFSVDDNQQVTVRGFIVAESGTGSRVGLNGLAILLNNPVCNTKDFPRELDIGSMILERWRKVHQRGLVGNPVLETGSEFRIWLQSSYFLNTWRALNHWQGNFVILTGTIVDAVDGIPEIQIAHIELDPNHGSLTSIDEVRSHAAEAAQRPVLSECDTKSRRHHRPF